MQRRLQLIGDPCSGAAGSIRFAVLMCIVSLILQSATCHQARAQDCSGTVAGGSSVAGIDGTVCDGCVDPDGSGPRTPGCLWRTVPASRRQAVHQLAAYDPVRRFVAIRGKWRAIIGPVYSILPAARWSASHRRSIPVHRRKKPGLCDLGRIAVFRSDELDDRNSLLARHPGQ